MHQQFHLRNVLPDIASRGESEFLNEAEKCVRLSAENDLTNGFFVACFERGASQHPPGKGPCKTDAGDVEVTITMPEDDSDSNEQLEDTDAQETKTDVAEILPHDSKRKVKAKKRKRKRPAADADQTITDTIQNEAKKSVDDVQEITSTQSGKKRRKRKRKHKPLVPV